jgi:cytochrome c biogenesis protein CcdA
MKYAVILLLLLLFASVGCIDSSPYKETGISELLETPADYEGKQVLVNGVFENGTISGIRILESGNFTGEYRPDGVLASVYGTYENGRITADSVEPVLVISTERYVYFSNDTLKVRVEFVSQKDGKAQVEVAGINNLFGKPLVSETRDSVVSKGSNYFDFVFKTPSCEECSALEPGVYPLNATVTMDGKEFSTYKKLSLQREDTNVTEQTGETESQKAVETQPTAEAPKTGENQSAVTVEYFYDPACQKCAKASHVIDNVVNSYGDGVSFSKHNVLVDEGLELARKYKLPGVPSVVINGQQLIAYGDYDGDIGKLEELLRTAIDEASTPEAKGTIAGKDIILSVPSVFVVGFLAGFNPCLLAILAFIASVTLATTGKRRNVLLIVAMFSLGIFVTYLIVGIGLLSIIQQSAALQGTITNIIVAVVGLLGIWHVYDAYHLTKNKDSSFYTPKAFVRLTEKVTEKVSLHAAFFIGALFSLIKAPCVGAVYFVILDMVRSGDGSGIMYLAAYNFGVVLPVLIIGGGIAFGLNPEKVEKFRKEKRAVMRLVTGITLLVIAGLMYVGII